MRKLLLLLTGLLFGAALPLWAAPDPVIRESVAVCNPAVPTQCAKPDSSGNLPVTGTTTPSGTASNAADGVATSTNNQSSVAYPFLWNGSTFDRWKGDATNGAFVNVKVLPALVAGTAIVGKFGIDQTTPGTTNGVQVTATTAAAPVVSASAESNHVLKATSGSLLSVSTTAGATAGFMLVFDATSAPVDGTVTPKYCIQVPANNFSAVSWPTPASFATGITVVFSTTGCFTKTASATAFFSGQVQ